MCVCVHVYYHVLSVVVHAHKLIMCLGCLREFLA